MLLLTFRKRLLIYKWPESRNAENLKLGRTFVFEKIRKDNERSACRELWKYLAYKYNDILSIQVVLQAADDRTKISRKIDIINTISEYVFISRL